MILNEQGGKVWTGFIWLRIGSSGGFFDRSGFIKGDEFFD